MENCVTKLLCTKPSMSVTEHNHYTICVKNAKKSYNQIKVLDNFRMKVPRGCIYALLGASGCGKTTLLCCLLGLKKIDSGDIYVLGGTPGTTQSGVPGPAIGYMPQNIAIIPEFTVRDSVYYFGRINNMDEWLIRERFETLKVLMELPPDDRRLKNCSGGQQRRVSLAAAMVHKPQLLILDEPTVGLDPVLRDKIWNHFVEIAEKEQTTIIITTHYIEEARRAHKIGLMRGGQLVAEECPERLLQHFNTESLEKVFLMLSWQQEKGQLTQVVEELANSSIVISSVEDDFRMSMQVQKKKLNAFCMKKHHLKSLMAKNIKQYLRNINSVGIAFILPVFQMMVFLTVIGKDPHDLKLAIVNEEAHSRQCANYTKNGTAIPYSVSECHFTNLACRFLYEIDNSIFVKDYYDNLHDAFEDARHGEVVGVLHMAKNFSDAYSSRVNDGSKVTNEDLDFSVVKVWLDMSHRQIGEHVYSRLYRQFQDFQASALKDCNYFEKLGRIPMRFYFENGIEGENYANFMLPGMFLTMVFFLGASLTSTIIVTERLEGVWDRSIVAGVTVFEIGVTHFAVEFVLLLIQTCELIILTFVIFGLDYEGSLYLIFWFILLQGLVGMEFGFLISLVSRSHTSANLACSGLFVPMLSSCGFIWPIEGQPEYLRRITMWLPFTQAIVSLRQVIKRGNGLEESQVCDGLGITIVWILIMSVLCIFVMKAWR